MPRKGNTIPKAPLSRIMKKIGVKRVSDDGLETFSNLLENYAETISKQAIRVSKHSGRKTILESDIKLALK